MIKKICFFVGHYDPARKVIMDYYEKIFPDYIELFVVCADKFNYEKFRLTRTKVIEILDNKYKVPFKLRKILKQNKIDIVINLTGASEIAFTMFIATIFSKTKTIVYFMGNPRLNFKNIFFLFSQFFTARFLACCYEVSEKFKKFLFFSKNKIFYLPHPINVHIFRPKNKIFLRKKFGIGLTEKVLIYIGRIELPQGSDYILKLIERNPDKKFILIGSMNDKDIQNKKFENVIYIPYVENKKTPDYYNMADICLFLSKRNSYPYPPREALACGIPVIVFNLNTFGKLKTNAAFKVGFEIEEIQKKINEIFSLPKKEKEILSMQARNFIINDSSEEKIKEYVLKYLTCF